MAVNEIYTPSSTPNRERQRIFLFALLAFAVVFILWQIPAAAPILYPVRLLVTFVHETGHGLAAIATGGRFLGFVVQENGSGLATTGGGNMLLILPMGYLGAALFGAVLIVLANRINNMRLVTNGIGIFFILIALLFAGSGTTLFIGAVAAIGAWLLADQLAKYAGWLRLAAAAAAALTLLSVLNNVALMIGLVFGALIIWLGVYSTPLIARFVLNVVAFLVGFNAISDVWSLMSNATAGIGPLRNDAYEMAVRTNLPVQLWIVLWTALALAMMVAAVYYTFFRRDT